jgi:hypothetical protein
MALVSSLIGCNSNGNGAFSGGHQPEPQGTRPAGVPPGAQLATTDERFASEEVGVLLTMNCSGGLLKVVTIARVFYAELPCDRSLPEDRAQRFSGRRSRSRYPLRQEGTSCV